MKTINLRGITNSLSENEMKHVKGGSVPFEVATPDLLADDGESSKPLSNKQIACLPPNVVGGYCEFYDDRGVLRGGRCVKILGQKAHCSNLN